MLQAVYERTGEDCETTVSGLALGEALGLSREETFRIVHYLTHRGYLRFVGAGPRVCIAPRGIDFLNSEAGRRRSIRDE